MRSCWVSMGLNPMADVLIKRQKFGYRDSGKKAISCWRQNWSDATACEGMPRVAGNQLEEARKDPFLEPLEGAWPGCQENLQIIIYINFNQQQFSSMHFNIFPNPVLSLSSHIVH